jgi:ATP-binding cassette subfamily B protein
MGLLQPTEGDLIIDDKKINERNTQDWQVNIAHVPQHIYLSDGTITDNIAFGVPKDNIDYERVEKSAYNALISNMISELPDKYETRVGERGVQLSGGQRQRIGIARAFYKNANVLIFDEATSALDNSTEHNIMNSIKNLDENLTILIIAHRLSTLKNCDEIVKLNKGQIVNIGSYEEIINNQGVDKC